MYKERRVQWLRKDIYIPQILQFNKLYMRQALIHIVGLLIQDRVVSTANQIEPSIIAVDVTKTHSRSCISASKLFLTPSFRSCCSPNIDLVETACKKDNRR